MDPRHVACLVVALRRRADRRAHLEFEARRERVLRLSFNTDRDLDVDAATLDLQKLPHVRCFPWQLTATDNKWWRRPLKLGEVACSLAHLALWRETAASADPYVVVLEDDAVLIPGFLTSFAEVVEELNGYDSDWDFLYLSRRRWARDAEIGLQRIVSPGYSACLHAYGLSRAGARKLLAADLERHMMPVDEFVPACMTVHPRPDVARAIAPVLRGYACRHDIASVLPKGEWGSDTEDTPFVAHPWQTEAV